MGKFVKEQSKDGKEIGRFQKRTKDTAAAFPPCNPRALAETITAVSRLAEEKMKAKDIRVSLDDSNESLGKKIRASKAEKTPYYIVVGEKEITAQKFNLENRAGEKIEGLSYDQIEEKLLKEIAEKK
jgi:threonyl-tRNA synthetase